MRDKMISFRATQTTAQQLAELAEDYGVSQAQIIAVAISALWWDGPTDYQVRYLGPAPISERTIARMQGRDGEGEG